VVDVVRSVALRSYGVTGLRAEGPLGGRIPWFRRHPPVEVILAPERLEIDLRISVAFGAPVVEVARQVDSAVRHAIQHALEREVDRLTIHVGALRVEPAAAPPSSTAHPHPTEDARPDDAHVAAGGGADERAER
jgi:uncharacterized alkaline shock family protein YloU